MSEEVILRYIFYANIVIVGIMHIGTLVAIYLKIKKRGW